VIWCPDLKIAGFEVFTAV